MKLDFAAQRDYCVKLGLILDLTVWSSSPAAWQVADLLTAMGTQAAKITDSAKWLRDTLDRVDTRFAGDPIHNVNLNSCGEAGRHALDYDMAIAAYCALQDQLCNLVAQIRRDQGYETRAFTRLEDHPDCTPEQDKARHELARREQHVASFRRQTPGAQRRHLREHGRKVTAATGPLALLHDQEHDDDLAALRAAAGNQPACP